MGYERKPHTRQILISADDLILARQDLFEHTVIYYFYCRGASMAVGQGARVPSRVPSTNIFTISTHFGYKRLELELESVRRIVQ